MSPLKTSLIVAVVSVVVTACGLHCSHQGRVREARHLRSQNNRMRLEANQRVMARQAAAPSPTSSESVAAGSASAPLAVPVARMAEYYRNEGNATPLATLQTFAWACDRGDTETVQRLLFVEEAARPKVEAFVAALPENVRAQWKTVDETVAAMLTESVMARPFPRHDILATATPEEVGTGRIRLRMPNVPRDGTEYQQTAEGWKYVLTEKVVDAYIKQSQRPAQ
ncbi:MAG: hypothetical protein QG602_1273 [Verrucomicrobiota bacterium]|nr:hypothetical protein [Verrucomicrobiota bacterium]